MGIVTNPKGFSTLVHKVKPPLIRVAEAAHLVDKNSITQVKLCQLLDFLNTLKNSERNEVNISNEVAITKKIVNLQHRMNRRLQKLAKWADHPAESRWKDLKPPLVRTNNFGRNPSSNKYTAVSASFRAVPNYVKPAAIQSVQPMQPKLGVPSSSFIKPLPPSMK